MQSFAAIDFEIANSYPSSICSVGVVTVRYGEFVERFYSLIQAVSVESPPQVSALPPTWFIGFRRARLWPLSASRTSSTDLLPPSALPRFAPCGFSLPPALRRADYRLAPVIVLPLWILVFSVVVRIVWKFIYQEGSGY